MPKVKKIELSFVCDEDWNKMTPVESGRHCSACAKTVVNFTGMSDAQIVAYYSQQKNEKSCGQFREGQLEHINEGLSRPEIKENRTWFKPILASALLSMGASCSQQKTKDSTQTKTEVETNDANKNIPVEIGKVCVDTTIRETGEVKTRFEPRKFTHVKSMDSVAQKDKELVPVVISHDIIKEREYQVLGGVPEVSYKDTERGEVYFKGDIHVSSDSVATKTKWHKRIFKKK